MIEETLNDYRGLFAYECPIGENLISTFVKSFINYHSVVLWNTSHSLHTDNGPITITTQYTYDDSAREIECFTKHVASGTGTRTVTAYNSYGWISDVISTEIKDTLEYIVKRKTYSYDSDTPSLPAKNPRPSESREFIINVPIIVPSNAGIWNADMQTADGTNSVQNTQYRYYDNYFPMRITFPGGNYTEYEWDILGRNLIRKTLNDSTKRIPLRILVPTCLSNGLHVPMITFQLL